MQCRCGGALHLADSAAVCFHRRRLKRWSEKETALG
jgi:hypothetical protein